MNPMRVFILLSVVMCVPALAEPAPYTVNTKTGLTRAAERNLYDAVRGMVAPVARWMGLNEAEEECANATAAEALIKATVEALKGEMFGLTGADKALSHFRKSQDDWCNKAGGMRGAKEMAPHLERAKSFMRPFLSERLQELKEAQSRPLTPAEVAAVIAAALVALPVLAPL